MALTPKRAREDEEWERKSAFAADVASELRERLGLVERGLTSKIARMATEEMLEMRSVEDLADLFEEELNKVEGRSLTEAVVAVASSPNVVKVLKQRRKRREEK